MYPSLTVCLLSFLAVISGQDVVEVLWKRLSLAEYHGLNTIDFFSFDIPTSTESLTLTLQGSTASGVSKGCPVREVKVHFQYGSFPVISPYNESFPKNFYLERSYAQNVTLHTDNKSVPVLAQSSKSGTWYLTAFLLPNLNKKIRPKGFTETCSYILDLKIVSSILVDVDEININKDDEIIISGTRRFKILRYILPDGTYSYTAVLDKCVVKNQIDDNDTDSSCPVTIDIAMDEVPHALSRDSYSLDCYNASLPCKMFVKTPYVSRWNYLRFSIHDDLTNFTDVKLNLHFEIEGCKIIDVNSSVGNQNSSTNNATCELILGLGHYSLSKEDFSGAFIFPDRENEPNPNVDIQIPDSTVLLTYFIMNAQTDSGGTLKIGIEMVEGILENSQNGRVWFCLMKYRIPSLDSVINCDGGIGLNTSTLSNDTTRELLYIPYPEEGKWYIGLHSMCVQKNDSRKSVPCKHLPTIQMDVELSKCIDRQCGKYGVCREYISGLLIYSACDCYGGWRGFGCTDGSNAVSESVALIAVLMLTISNLFFIPGILIALRRGYYVEAFVYLYNMFFSTFYHACDTNKLIHQYCMMPYNVLSYCDLYGSISSFWVTILAMASISDKLRTFLHVLGALCIALGVEYNQHYSRDIWAFLIPTLICTAIFIVSWIKKCYGKRSCFPSKKWYIRHFLPGIVLSGTGLLIFTLLETDDNYKYTHSVWHITISLSIVFFLPPKGHFSGAKFKNRYRGESTVRMIQNAANFSDNDDDDDEPLIINHSNSSNSDDDEPLIFNHSSRNLVL